MFVVDAHRNGSARYGGTSGRPTQAFPAIAFRQGDWAGQLPQHVDIAYRVGVNRWQGNTNLQLVIEDIRPAEEESITL